ncbi:MAG: alpha/beta fold hydrolase [Pseudomonadota bacterium]
MSRHIIFLSGIFCDWGLWEGQIATLSDIATCQYVAPKGATLREMAISVLSETPESFSLAASSMGGYIAMYIAQIAPERIEALFLSNVSAQRDHSKQRELRLSTIEELKSGDFHLVVERLLPALLSPGRRADEALIDTIRRMMHRVGRKTTLRQQLATIDRPDFRSYLPEVEIPTLVLTAENDRVTPPELGVEIASLIKGARLEHLATSGHLSALESQAEVTDLMRDWLLS